MQIEKLNNIKDFLIRLYNPTGPERVGFLKDENKIVEVPNVANLPNEGFRVEGQVIVDHTEKYGCWGTWHTHPGEDANLSGEDYRSFKFWPDLYHFIIGNDGVRCFKWDDEKQAILEVE